MGFVVGIDVSTTATKAVLIDPVGRVVGIGTAEYGVQSPHPLWSEQDPASWWEGLQTAMQSLLASTGASGEDIEGIGLTGQMHGAVLLDGENRVLRPAILWNDQRTSAECEEIRARVGADRLIRITGNDAITGLTAPKLLWVRRHEPDIWAQVRHVLLPKDYLRLRLTGGYESATAATGLKAGTPVVAGGGDQAANAVGVGVVDEGTVALSLGTSGVVFAATRSPIHDPAGRVHAFCHAVPDRWHLMSVMLSAAGSLRWFRDAVAPEIGFGDLAAAAADVRAAEDGLFFLPYLTGERSPHPDPLARGAFVGLTLQHDRRHLTRAVLEGVAFGLRDGLDLMIAAGMPAPTEIRASGGGLASPAWRQILADVLDAELATPSTTEGAAFGAAVLAAVGVGWFRDVPSATAALVRTTPAAMPGPGRAMYAEAHGTYRDLYPALAPIFHQA